MRHPIYAGAYRWGHREIDPKKKIAGRPGTGKTLKHYRDCRVLIQNRFDAYISWDQFECNQQTLDENGRNGVFRSSPKRGASLLAGLVQCGRCGRSMSIGYSCNRLRYSCQRGALDYGEEPCQSLSGAELDEHVGRLLLTSLQPASIRLSLAAANDITKQRAEANKNWQHRLERVDYEVTLANRQYAAVDPDNRLVARELETLWEQKLREQEQLRLEYRRFTNENGKELSADEIRQIESLSKDIESLWKAETSCPEDKQVIARILLERVVVTVEKDSEHVDVEVRFRGGFIGRFSHRRPVQTYDQVSNYRALVGRVEQLQQEGRTLAQIADALNAEGFRPVKRAAKFKAGMICKLMRRERERRGVQPKSPRDEKQLRKNEWWLPDLAMHLKMPVTTLHRWRKVGWVVARKVEQTGGHWAIFADEAELQRMHKLRDHKHNWKNKSKPVELISPSKSCR